MKRKPFRMNPASPKKKNSKGITPVLNLENQLHGQVLTWDGIRSAMIFSVPFVVVTAINFQTSIVLTLVLAAILIPIGLLSFFMREKWNLPSRLTAPTCSLVSLGIVSIAAFILRRYQPQASDTLGFYIYLLAAYPVVDSVFDGKQAQKAVTAFAWSMRNILYFGILTCTAGIVRELLAYNRIFGLDIDMNFRLEAARAPFFGFIVLAFILAAVAKLHLIIKGDQAAAPEKQQQTETAKAEIKKEGEVG